MRLVFFLLGIGTIIAVLSFDKIGDRFGCSVAECTYAESQLFESDFRNVHYVVSTGNGVPPQTRKIILGLFCPKEFRINMTPVVRFTYNEMDEYIDLSELGNMANKTVPKSYVQSKNSSEDSLVELGSSGVDVYPAKAIDIVKGRGLPLELNWTIAAKRTGEHHLILNIRHLINSMALVEDSVFKINGTELKLPSSGELAIPIKVLTEWGLSDKTELVIKGALSFVAFIMMCPIFLSLYQGRRKRDDVA